MASPCWPFLFVVAGARETPGNAVLNSLAAARRILRTGTVIAVMMKAISASTMEDDDMDRITSRTSPASAISPEMRQRMIGEAAYYRSSRRGFEPGHELEDWFAAEADFERANYRQRPPEPHEAEEFGMQYSGARGPAKDDALKRMVKQHPRREIPRTASIEPEESPLKE